MFAAEFHLFRKGDLPDVIGFSRRLLPKGIDRALLNNFPPHNSARLIVVSNIANEPAQIQSHEDALTDFHSRQPCQTKSEPLIFMSDGRIRRRYVNEIVRCGR